MSYVIFGGIHDNGNVMVMDLTTPLNVQRAKYSKVYSKIRQLKRCGYHLKEGNSIDDIKSSSPSSIQKNTM